MRYEKDERGKRRFTVDEFLSPQQVQSYFSRAAAKLKNKQEEITEEDIAAAEEQATLFAYSRNSTFNYMTTSQERMKG